MATFQNLYHASHVLRQVLLAEMDVSDENVIIGPMPETVGATEAIYVTLAWQQEHALHRNDGYQRNPDGSSTPPPVTLSLFYLITTYGGLTAGNAEMAHRRLGEVIRSVHASSVLKLTSGSPLLSGLLSPPDGELTLTHVPLTPELMEKLFSLFQVKHRPFMICEVGPVQLVSDLADRAPGPVVAPDGVKLFGPTPRERPTIKRVVPSTLAKGGWLRIDGRFDATVDLAVVVGGVRFEDDAVEVVEAGRSVAVQLPSGSSILPPGVYDVSVVSGTLASERDQVQVVPAGSWSLDARRSDLPLATEVVFTGQNLGPANKVYLWPDAGIRAPEDVRDFDPTSVGATGFTIQVTGLHPGTYRMAAAEVPAAEDPPEPGVARYTPYVVVEVRT